LPLVPDRNVFAPGALIDVCISDVMEGEKDARDHPMGRAGSAAAFI
jgi:hypothetical protein